MVFGIGVLMTAFFTLLSPVAADVNFIFFIIVRVLEGMGEVGGEIELCEIVYYFYGGFFLGCYIPINACYVS